jgi:F-type H+-transporting ATPase subunit epsilon
MPHAKFPVEVLTPEGEKFNDEAEMVSTRTTLGQIGVLANMSPVLGMLEPTELRIYKSDDEILRFAQSEGYLQVAGNHVLLLVEELHRPEELDVAQLRDRLAQAERDLEAAGDDTEKQRLARRDKLRWEAFLRVAEGGHA